MSDPAVDALACLIEAVRSVFTPTQTTPPTGGGTNDVRFMAGDQLPLAAWDAHNEGSDCQRPFLWVRLVHRYRSTPEAFPAPVTQPDACGLYRALELEAGVARCAVIGESPSFDEYNAEATVALDDSFRLDVALCRAVECLTGDGASLVAVGNVAPFGPQGGIIAASTNLYVLLGKACCNG